MTGSFALRDCGAGKAEPRCQFIQGKIQLFPKGLEFTKSKTWGSHGYVFL